MSAEIGNKSLLRQVADFLEILDLKVMAGKLKTDAVIPVIDIGRGGFGGSPALEIESVSSSSSLGGTTGGSAPGVYTNINGPSRCLAFHMNLNAPVGAAATDLIDLRIFFTSGDESTETNIVRLKPWDRQNTSAYTRYFAMWGSQTVDGSQGGRPFSSGWNGYIPERVSFGWELSLITGTFPAGTEITYTGLFLKGGAIQP